MHATKHLTVVFLSGMWGGEGSGQWKYWRASFEKAGYCVVEIILKGHRKGESPAGATMSDYIAQVTEEVHKIGPCILVTHSMGAVVGQKVAGVEDNVKKIVIVTSAAPRGIRGLNLWTLNFVRKFKYLIPILLGRAYKIEAEDARELMMNELPDSEHEFDPCSVFPSAESGRASLQLALGGVHINPIRRCPSMVIGCEKDRMTSLSIQKKLAQRHRSKLIITEGGHLPMLERDRYRLASRMIEWFERAA